MSDILEFKNYDAEYQIVWDWLYNQHPDKLGTDIHSIIYIMAEKYNISWIPGYNIARTYITGSSMFKVPAELYTFILLSQKNG